MRELLRAYGQHTAPTPEQVRRARMPTPRVRPWSRVLALVVAVGIVAWWRWPTPPLVEPVVPPERPAPAAVVALPVDVPLPPGASAPRPDLRLRVDGEGAASADGAALRWVVGALEIEADGPLRVDTDDAALRADAGAFRVYRDALGTEVTGRAGVGRVRCGTAAPTVLGPGESRFCLPGTPAGWLGRAQALGARGAPSSEVRAAAEAGLGAGATDAVRGELQVVRIRSLLGDGRDADALVAVRGYLAEPHPERRVEVLGLAVDLAVRAGDCADVAAWSAELRRDAPPCGG